jgi:hypothetical protein
MMGAICLGTGIENALYAIRSMEVGDERFKGAAE